MPVSRGSAPVVASARNAVGVKRSLRARRSGTSTTDGKEPPAGSVPPRFRASVLGRLCQERNPRYSCSRPLSAGGLRPHSLPSIFFETLVLAGE